MPITDVLDVLGLIAVTLAAFLLAIWLGFAVLGSACLLASWSMTRRARRAAESAAARRGLRAA